MTRNILIACAFLALAAGISTTFVAFTHGEYRAAAAYGLATLAVGVLPLWYLTRKR